MAGCNGCERCSCKRYLTDESEALRCIKKDLDSLQFKKPIAISSKLSQESSLEEASEGPKEAPAKTCRKRVLNAEDLDSFRVQAISGVAALEEMKEQIDTLHELVRKYYREFPCDHEKIQIDECEDKFHKCRAEFDEVSENLCSLLNKFNSSTSQSRVPCKGGRRKSSSDSEREVISTKVHGLQKEEKRLRSEISDGEQHLEKIRKDLEKYNAELLEKKSISEAHEREIKARDEEISKLRTGIKGFRERLREMQIDIKENLGECSEATTGDAGSISSLSVLSEELQQLCDILSSPQNPFPDPDVVERQKEENRQLKEKLHCLEKCLRNKEESLSLVQQSLKKRECQMEEMTRSFQAMTMDLTKMRKELEEKNRLICNLQDSMRKAKEFEIKVKDESIGELQSEVCELDSKLKDMAKEVVKKGKELEVLKDEVLYVSSKNFFLNRELDLLEPRLDKARKTLYVYEGMVCTLQEELDSRENEIEALCNQVKELEKELETELKKCEQRAQDDSMYINELSETVRNLQNELYYAKESASPPSTARSVQPQRRISQQHEPCCQYNVSTEMKNLVCRLRNEIRALKRRLREAEINDEINAKVEGLGSIVRQGECRQSVYNNNVSEMEKILKDKIESHECEKNELLERLRNYEAESAKNLEIICGLNELVQQRSAAENTLKCTLKRFRGEMDALGEENENLRNELCAARGRGGNSDSRARDSDKLISDLKVRCDTLKSELDKEEKVKKTLECRINELNNMLESKTHQFNQLSQSYQCTSAKAQEALSKLKDAEHRLKCVKSGASKKQLEESNEDAEEGQSWECQQAQKMRKQACLQQTLEAKNAECTDLLTEVQSLEVKIKSMQGEYISAQANKDCELSRMSREISRLENELDFVEKENLRLRRELQKAQEDVRNRGNSEVSIKEDYDKKERELFEALCEKNKLLESIDDLQKRLEDFCMENTKIQKENKELREERDRLKKELHKAECELKKLRQEFQSEYECLTEKLKSGEKKRLNMEKLFCNVRDENAVLQESKTKMEKELSEMKTENVVLKEKMISAKKNKDKEGANAAHDKMKYCAKIKELAYKIKNLEEKVIPEMQEELSEKERCIENFKEELQEANASGQRMRDESLRVIQCTKKYLAAQRCANEAGRMRAECSNDNRHRMSNETRNLEEQLKSVIHMNDYLFFELQNEKNNYHDTEPRSFSPFPWGCSHVERDNNSPEYLVESGFQSMQPSPTNMNYSSECSSGENKRSTSQWNTMGRHMEGYEYSQSRNNSIR